MIVSGKIVDVHNRRIFPGNVHLKGKRINQISETAFAPDVYILPGLVDAHIHIESSMVTPQAFAETAVSRGTTAVVSDPHEIANVLGIAGVNYMIRSAEKVPLKFFFGAPSCVPATIFESTGGKINSEEIENLLIMPGIKYLAEMMNFPGVIYNDREVRKKIDIAHKLHKTIDGHAPGLTGEPLEKYISAGITTDHECTTLVEAEEKIRLGMKILIREGSASRDLDSLKDLYKTNPEMIMLCSDDLHPEMLLKRHINKLVSKLIMEGFDLFDVIRSCTVNPVRHYKLEAGTLKQNDPADFIIVDDLNKMNVHETWINGNKIFDRGNVLFDLVAAERINNFNCSEIKPDDLFVRATGNKLRVIQAYDGSLLTKELTVNVKKDEIIKPDLKSDILKIVVKDRYRNLPCSVGFINGFGLKSGAFAGSVAHDSHNIICVGTNDADIIRAVNKIIALKGGLVVADEKNTESLPLPVAGIMSDLPVNQVAASYEKISHLVRTKGCTMSAPFMTLSFMALLVIPELKLSDRGLFDGNAFSIVPLFKE